MSEYNMTDKEYNILYKRYLDRDPKELLEMASLKEGDRVLDLCAGANGRATKAAIKMGASYVVPVDLNPNVKKLHAVNHALVYPYCEDIGGFLQYAHILKNEKFDVVICQQGVNYWFKKNLAGKLWSIMRKGARFVFNTFNKKPSDIPQVKEYTMDGNHHYVEVAWMSGKNVQHVQIFNNAKPHFTEFRWIPEEEFVSVMEPTFDVKIKREGSTDIYVCTKLSRSL